jgi:colanic acid/amylovoran biosynthesis glycosyltransferase
VRVGYVLKRYPRYSETFVVNEILAHEAAGLELEIFALRPPMDSHFQDAIARVRAPVHYIPNEAVKSPKLWEELRAARATLPHLRDALDAALDEDALDVRRAFRTSSPHTRRTSSTNRSIRRTSPARSATRRES